jgi:hypothetical protein
MMPKAQTLLPALAWYPTVALGLTKKLPKYWIFRRARQVRIFLHRLGGIDIDYAGRDLLDDGRKAQLRTILPGAQGSPQCSVGAVVPLDGN